MASNLWRSVLFVYNFYTSLIENKSTCGIFISYISYIHFGYVTWKIFACIGHEPPLKTQFLHLLRVQVVMNIKGIAMNLLDFIQILIRPFFKCQSKTLNFQPLTLNQIANSFFASYSLLFFHLKLWVPKPYTPPFINFQIFGPHFLMLVPICSSASQRSENRYA